MTDKARRFPLSLSALSQKPIKSPYGKPSSANAVATPQTATKNSAQDNQHRASRLTSAAALSKPGPGGLADGARSAPLVPDSLRRAMVARLARQGITNQAVLSAMEAVPRHLFMEPGFSSQAYVDASIPIGYQQTISQPYIVARMLEILCNGRSPERVLEIGTGCGYQAAVLSRVAKEVFSVERIKQLHELAKNNLRPLRIANIRLQYGDGMLGLPQAAPFDGIILAAAGLEVPRLLLEQLAIGGRLVAPVGARQQELQLIERTSKSEWSSVALEQCHFVPLCSGTA
ncbi:protein-L-isoaspartate(D-aspartate) O-methyltransferase [Herminiimonas sp. CN]|uniref:protein-L-isoaspartate(D-aspartate) O-methyltransferase n=1 Tax=Herminiimonas sp. CN TaxID=1349818 RepID=UPI0004730FCC|nr:protein-L-isoaspartate(D-aspartate) O-methyltransferase [Herminiimonas sp. CN]